MAQDIKMDVAIIGAGLGGYVAAIRAAQLGKSVVLIEKDKLGGTCLNYGCIPSKDLLTTTEQYERMKNAASYGLSAEKVSFDWPKMQARKAKNVMTLVKGVEFLCKGNKITVLAGSARFLDARHLEVSLTNGEAQRIEAGNIIIATGSIPIALKDIPFDGKAIIDSTAALDLTQVPQSFGVVGAGAIGLEVGSIYRRLGAEVTVVEMLDYILPEVDPEAAQVAAQLLKKQGFTIHTGYVVKSAVVNDGKVDVVAVPREGKGEEKRFTVEKLLVAVGRKANTEGLGLEKAGVAPGPRGFIQTNERMETSVKGIYAIGDVIGGKLLAHKASREGIVAAEAIAGKGTVMNYRAVPGSVFTSPEVASVGLKEEEARAKGTAIRVGKFLFRANGRALTLGEADGFVKILADAETDEILGAHIVGSHASDLITEVTVAMEFEGTAEDLASTIHIHPTLTEAVMEAAEAVHGNAIHMVNRQVVTRNP